MDLGIGQTWPGRQLLIAQRLRARRADLGLTQKQVVTRLARCGVRTTNRALSSLEHGAGLDVAKLPEIAVALDCTVTFIVGLTDDPDRWEPDVGSDRTGAGAVAAGRRVAPHIVDERPVTSSASLILGAGLPDRGLRLATVRGSVDPTHQDGPDGRP
ncbi:MAG: helix-turn-helix domain-containing protein [Jatrophihabitantaceae bacterium]